MLEAWRASSQLKQMRDVLAEHDERTYVVDLGMVMSDGCHNLIKGMFDFMGSESTDDCACQLCRDAVEGSTGNHSTSDVAAAAE